MKTTIVVAAVALAASVGAAAWCLRAGRSDVARAAAADAAPRDLAQPGAGAAPAAAPQDDPDARSAAPRSIGRDATPPPDASRGAPASAQPRPPAVAWPITTTHASTSSRGSRAAAMGEPEVPTKLAFRALWYLGVDPDAETTWARAINDPRHPPGVRSDLIVDMIDEGYTDNDRPGPADLPTILARLEILERHAPHALDEVNARAFAAAYRTMLEHCVRLGGAPRTNGAVR